MLPGPDTELRSALTFAGRSWAESRALVGLPIPCIPLAVSGASWACLGLEPLHRGTPRAAWGLLTLFQFGHMGFNPQTFGQNKQETK